MAKLGFFDVLFDNNLSWNEASAINQASDRADAALDQGVMLGESIGKLHRRVQLQAKEIDVLKTALAVLVKVLEESSVVDAGVLDYRLEAALAEAEAEAEEARAESARAAATRMCVACSLSFPVARLNVTEMGELCDGCLAKR